MTPPRKSAPAPPQIAADRAPAAGPSPGPPIDLSEGATVAAEPAAGGFGTSLDRLTEPPATSGQPPADDGNGVANPEQEGWGLGGLSSGLGLRSSLGSAASSWGSWAADKTKQAASAAVTVTAVAGEVAAAVAEDQRKRVRGETVQRDGEEHEQPPLLSEEPPEVAITSKLTKHEDMRQCAALVYMEAARLATTPSNRCDVESIDHAADLLAGMIHAGQDGSHQLAVARTVQDNQCVGFMVATRNSAAAEAPTAGLGPFATHPGQGRPQIETALLQDLLARCEDCQRITVVQESAEGVSLFAGLGFVIEEPLAMMEGYCSLQPERRDPEIRARPMAQEDFPAVASLSVAVSGRGSQEGELLAAVASGEGIVVENAVTGEVVAYSTTTRSVEGHTCGSRPGAVELLLEAASGERPVVVLVPLVRQPALFATLLEAGLTTAKLVHRMARGARAPLPAVAGCCLPALYNP